MNITQLPFPKHTGLRHIKEITLTQDLYLDQWIIPAGAKIKLGTSRNFGYVFVPFTIQDKRGFPLPKHIFRY